MSHYIFDEDIIDAIALVEGDGWAKLQRHGVQQVTFVSAFVAAWAELQDMLKGSDGVWTDNVAPRGGDTIYGKEGYSRWVVRPTGEVVLLGSSTRPERVMLARQHGFTAA